MSTKKLLVLTGIFLALFAFVFFYERNQPTSEERAAARKRLLDFKAEDVAAVVVERPDLPKVELKRMAAGRWSVQADPPGRADSFTADNLISDLGRLELVGEVQSRFDPKEYGLDAPRGKVTLVFKDGSKKTISFGKEIPGTDGTVAAEGSRMGAVRFASLLTLKKPVNDFRSKRLLDTPVSDVTRVTIVRGPNRIVVSRDAGGKRGAHGAWRIEAPVTDLANGAFVDRLLADLSSTQISEYPAVSATDLPRVGLAPPASTLTIQKGDEVVGNLAFGATKADAVGKIYARDEGLVVVVDDRIQEELGKEFTAFRETRVLPVDVFRLRRVQFDSGDLHAGADRVDGEWRSAGRAITASLVDNLVGRLARAENRGFVTRKDYAARGIAASPKAVPLATMEVLEEESEAPRTARFFAAAAGGGPPAVAAEVSGRQDAILVDAAILDDLKREAGRLRDAAKEAPAAGPKEAPKEPPKPPATAAPAAAAPK
jgi:hypothetical protein